MSSRTLLPTALALPPPATRPGGRRPAAAPRYTPPRVVTVRPVCAVKKQFTSFEQLLAESTTPVLVDFYATWCGPCQMLAPILADVKAAFGDRLSVVKIDTEKYPALASRYKVQGLPTVVLFKAGEPVDRIEGLPQKEQLIQRLQYFLG